LPDIDSKSIDLYKKDREELAPCTVRNHLVLLATMLRLAVQELGWLHSVPVVKKPRVDPDDEQDPPWLKSQADIDRLLDAARAAIDPEDALSEVPFVMYSTAVHSPPTIVLRPRRR
jgi:hypothetical protein